VEREGTLKFIREKREEASTHPLTSLRCKNANNELSLDYLLVDRNK